MQGYWDRSDVEIDLVAVSEEQKTIRFGTCKRQADKLAGSMPTLAVAAARFLAAHKMYQHWNVEHVAIAPRMTQAQAVDIRRQGARLPTSCVSASSKRHGVKRHGVKAPRGQVFKNDIDA